MSDHLPAASSADMVAATFADRVTARIIDGVLLAALTLALAFTVIVWARVAGVPLGTARWVMWLLAGISVTAGLAYEAVLTATYGQTLGKRVMQIKVIDLQNPPHHPTWRQSLVRVLIPTVGLLLPGVGWVALAGCYASAAYNDLRRGWHERAAETMVIAAP